MSRRADNNDGSCREILTGRQAGRWRVQYRFTDECGIRARKSWVFKTKSEAKAFLQDLRRGARVQQVAQTRELTFGEWFDWLAVHDWPETLASVTVAQRRARFRKYAAKYFAHIPISRIDPLQVRAFYRRLRDEGASENLVLSVKHDLVRAFNQAVTPYQQVPMTLANPFRLPLPHPKPRQAVALTPEEVKAAIGSNRLTAPQRAMLALFLLAGLRLGEVMAITAEQIRLDADLIAIDRAARIEFGGKQSVGLPKGKKTRTAVMCRTLKSIMAPFIAEMAPEQVLWPAENANKPRMKKRIYDAWSIIYDCHVLKSTAWTGITIETDESWSRAQSSYHAPPCLELKWMGSG